MTLGQEGTRIKEWLSNVAWAGDNEQGSTISGIDAKAARDTKAYIEVLERIASVGKTP